MIGVPVPATGPVPRQLGVDRATLAASGFDGKVGETLVVPRRGGPSVVAVGIGDPAALDATALRDAAAAFARAAGKHPHVATTLADVAAVEPELAGQVVVEGLLLARYRYSTLKRDAPASALTAITLVAGSARAQRVERGAGRGRVIAGAAQLARDLANIAARPPDRQPDGRGGRGRRREQRAAGRGVRRRRARRPRLRRAARRQRRQRRAAAHDQAHVSPAQPAAAHLAMVGKGVMYDSGGISLKPTDPMHAAMKMDMSGAAAVLASMSALAAVGCRTAVTGYLMCTDNMPSGSAMKLGDVLTIHGGTTVEIHNTDAEGRLLLADGLALATEEQPDAVVDIATLTGACMVALGPSVAGVFGNDQSLIEQVRAASAATDEAVWQLPLEKRYRKLLDSDVADVKNVGGPYGGAITAAVFLSEFVGDLPWAHLDIAGPMKVDADEAWRSKGATGFGTRLLIELATSFTKP